MTLFFASSGRLVAALLLGMLPLAALAQTTSGSQNPTQAELLRRGDLVGGRPHASQPRTARLNPAAATTAPVAPAAGTRATAAPPASADPVLARLLHERIAIGQVPATDLPDLYERFLEATRTQRRQWSASDWAEASAALSRLNARYETVRLELPLSARLDVRSAQGEFRTLEAARATKDRLNGD